MVTYITHTAMISPSTFNNKLKQFRRACTHGTTIETNRLQSELYQMFTSLNRLNNLNNTRLIKVKDSIQHIITY